MMDQWEYGEFYYTSFAVDDFRPGAPTKQHSIACFENRIEIQDTDSRLAGMNWLGAQGWMIDGPTHAAGGLPDRVVEAIRNHPAYTGSSQLHFRNSYMAHMRRPVRPRQD